MKRKSSTGGTASDAPTESCTEGTTPAAIYIPPNRSNYLALTTSSMPPSAIPTSVPPKLVRVPIHVDDAKDNVFVGIVRALLLTGNVPCGPAEIAAICVKWDVAVSGLGWV